MKRTFGLPYGYLFGTPETGDIVLYHADRHTPGMPALVTGSFETGKFLLSVFFRGNEEVFCENDIPILQVGETPPPAPGHAFCVFLPQIIREKTRKKFGRDTAAFRGLNRGIDNWYRSLVIR